MFTKPHKKTLIAFVFAIATTSCLSTTAPKISSYGSGTKRILFIGNSLTSANDMPYFFVALAESAKVSPLPSVQVDWQPDFALIDHWSTGAPISPLSKRRLSCSRVSWGRRAILEREGILELRVES